MGFNLQDEKTGTSGIGWRHTVSPQGPGLLGPSRWAPLSSGPSPKSPNAQALCHSRTTKSPDPMAISFHRVGRCVYAGQQRLAPNASREMDRVSPASLTGRACTGEGILFCSRLSPRTTASRQSAILAGWMNKSLKETKSESKGDAKGSSANLHHPAHLWSPPWRSQPHHTYIQLA